MFSDLRSTKVPELGNTRVLVVHLLSQEKWIASEEDDRRVSPAMSQRWGATFTATCSRRAYAAIGSPLTSVRSRQSRAPASARRRQAACCIEQCQRNVAALPLLAVEPPPGAGKVLGLVRRG